ncbi:Hypothetical predicted protein, partial [Paramuricea clavata]
METKLFSIVLCLLILEAAGSSLKNLTSIQHGTENASARSTVDIDPSTQGMKLPSTQGNIDPSTQGMKLPSTQGNIDPSTQGMKLPSTQGSIDPSTQGMKLPSTQGSIDPSTQGMKLPSTQGSIDPSTQGMKLPSTQGSIDPSTQGMKLPSTQGSIDPSTQGMKLPSSQQGFPMRDYDRELYERIEGALGQQQPFSFLMIANSYDTRFNYPQKVNDALVKSLVDLGANGIFPSNAKSNLVIAGVTNDVSAKIPNSAEEKLVLSIPQMIGYYGAQYVDATETLSCPWIVVLGSTSDTCYTTTQ